MFVRLVNAVCFWLLASLAMALFVIAVIMPPFQEYQRNIQTERDMEAAVRQLDQRVADNEREIKLLDPQHPDPLMVAKLARGLLNYRLEGGREVRIGPAGTGGPEAGPQEPADDRLLPEGANDNEVLPEQLANPETLRKLENPQVRRSMLFMAGVSILLAFALFGAPWKRRRHINQTE